MPLITNENAHESWKLITPIFKLSLDGEAKLIGTGFFVTSSGVIVTAKHVITDNIGPDGDDIGGIAAIHFFDNHPIVRPLAFSTLHPYYDLALCETWQIERPSGERLANLALTLTLEAPTLGTPVSTHAYHDIASAVEGEKYPTSAICARMEFCGVFALDPEKEISFSFNSRVSVGYVTSHFTNGRDAVMIPFPCFETDIPIYAGMSGGPVFDNKGRVFAVNCTRIEGTDIAYHTPLEGVLDLYVRNTTFADSEKIPRDRTIRELATLSAVSFDPLIE